MKRNRGSALVIALIAVAIVGAVIVSIRLPQNTTSLVTTLDNPTLTKPTSDKSINNSDNGPYAWPGQAYAGKIGREIEFDASGSYDPTGTALYSYEWDFDADGVFDLKTTEKTATHTYDSAFNDLVILRVTGKSGTATATVRTVINEQGYVSQGDEHPCPLDENGYSIIINEKRDTFLNCTPTNLPTGDRDGVVEITY